MYIDIVLGSISACSRGNSMTAASRNLITSTTLALFITACAQGGSLSFAKYQSELSSSSVKILGEWLVNTVECNAMDVTTSYISAGGTLLYKFDGNELIQARTSTTGCLQETSMPYEINDAVFTVTAGTTYAVSCTPASCTGTGLLPASACATTGLVTSTVTTSIEFDGNQLNSSENDAQATSICALYGATAPLALSLTKQ